MTTLQIVLSSVFALSLALGQILFKQTALHWQKASATNPSPLAIISPWFFAAVVSYGATALLWIYILRTTSLSKAYIFSMAGSALVPIAAFLLFKETISVQYWLGFALMLTGLYLCVR